jgi:predicted PurR-regulated permease PerM
MDARQQTFGLIVRSLLVAAGIAVLVLAALQLRELLVLVFGAVVIGVLIRALADVIERRTPLGGRGAFYAALLLIVLVIATFAWLFGAQVGAQVSQLSETIPEMWERIQDWLLTVPGGEALLTSVQNFSLDGGDSLASVPRVLGWLASAITDFLLVLFGAVFIASNPGLYRRGLATLFPRSRRALADEALGESAQAIKLWMVGQFISMAVVGTLTALGLWLAGVPAALALGLIMGFLEIIPFIGPFLGSVPILIMALSAGPDTALLALAVILVVQQAEGSLVTPLVQKKVISLPPAVTVFGVIAGGVLFGPPGLLFAAPLLVVVFVLVKRLYVEEALHTPTYVPGRDD